jgi:MoaA/NifB/PqqE/SkfB family radical SAM enzyme
VRDITLLWALRSPCAFACPHCYFGTIEEHKDSPPGQPGLLSHLSRTDLPLQDLADFARTLPGSPVERVVIAGGEPLDWPGTLGLTLGADAVSVSLDSADATVNDQMRPSRSGRLGYHDVLAGISTLLQARSGQPVPRVGIYTVVTRSRPHEITAVAQLAASLGVDYYVPQPISLPPSHKLFGQLAHTPGDTEAAGEQLTRLYHDPMGLALPDPSYPGRFLTAISTQDSGHVPGCFGGAQLFFIQPDGSVWDCPSDRRIAATPPARHRSIRGGDARTLFAARPACTDCSLFSRDCVNMWPLVLDMPRLLSTGAAR